MAVIHATTDRGAALLLALVATALLGALGVSLLVLADTELRVASNDGSSLEAFYAADAALERAVQELATLPEWSSVLTGAVKSSFSEPTTSLVLPSKRSIDLIALTAALQGSSNTGGSQGVNTPVWRLFAWGPLTALASSGWIENRVYVAVWVADDPSETDGNPGADTNGVVFVHAEAFGVGGARRMVEATVARVSAGIVRELSWKEVR
jgi:Tfp pilus assembly protein PilX